MRTGGVVYEWVAYPEEARPGELTPDLTPNHITEGTMCKATHPDGYCCTRLATHTKRHAAGNGDVIVAVWS